MEKTLSIIKPDGVSRGLIAPIYQRFTNARFKIVEAKMLTLSAEQAQEFYQEHKGKPFFDGLVAFMSSGPIMVQVLEAENAIQSHRDLMGATNPAEAATGTLRYDFATAMDRNVVHGSDSPAAAAREIAFFFSH